MADLQKVVKLTSSQYSTLAGGGTVGSYTGLDSSYLYLVEDSTQYVPLGGTTSLYGSIVPSTDNSIALGSSYRGFASLYVKSIIYPGMMSIHANTDVVGAGVGGGLAVDAGTAGITMSTRGNIEARASSVAAINAGSYISMSSPNIYLSASGYMDLYALSGMNNIYGASGVNIWTYFFSEMYPPLRMSMWMSGGYYPLTEIVASYSGMGTISLNAGTAIYLSTGGIYGFTSLVSTQAKQVILSLAGSDRGAIEIYLSNNSATYNNINVRDRYNNVMPIYAGYTYNVRLQWADFSFTGGSLWTNWPAADGYVQFYGLRHSQNYFSVSTPALDYLFELLYTNFPSGYGCIMCTGELKTAANSGWPHIAAGREDWVIRAVGWRGAYTPVTARSLYFDCACRYGGNSIDYDYVVWPLSQFKPSGTNTSNGWTSVYYSNGISFMRLITLDIQMNSTTTP